MASVVETFGGAGQCKVVGPWEELPKMNAGRLMGRSGANSTFAFSRKRVPAGVLGSEKLSRIGGLIVIAPVERLGWRGLIDLKALSAGNVVFAMSPSRVEPSNALTGEGCSDVLRFLRVPTIAEGPFEHDVEKPGLFPESARSEGFAGLDEIADTEGMGLSETEAAIVTGINVDFCVVGEASESFIGLPMC